MSWLQYFTPFELSSMTAEARDTLSRRDLFGGLGALIVGFSALGKASGQVVSTTVELTQVDSWVAVGADGLVTAFTGKCEFGQGFRTVQYQLVADELYVPLNRVRLIVCDTGVCPDQGVSSGSQAHIAEFGNAGLRQALATARDALLQMASARLGVPVSALMIKDGNISMKTDATRRVNYASLVGGQKFQITVNAKAAPKDPATYTVLARRRPAGTFRRRSPASSNTFNMCAFPACATARSCVHQRWGRSTSVTTRARLPECPATSLWW